ncbi:hypothetical protein D0864_07485 [Hortaea werneckii]|uniref:Elongator complex protein 6 n=1 Tax=Hortaea werneckii TaxID=91943 RepID=A0A3M7F7W5_HORWE|nr:hypothetical protein KC352_g22078 [Hortaea werneckii]KAI7571071.1 hypothetical protein KC317_g1939 [Hortaea werneckii]KAI7615731.1 hypothetical protein KC346_g6330 [Hortaea werneckii]KAI7679166.1 hypothetical protein KC319_g2922 [Hortaea werneckii]KAI7699851.1 hypothetical protein KC322_g8584 [Hortaea werneckii]
MSSRNRIPPALEPYLRLPPETAQILLTGTLGCSIEWLTTRFVGTLLAPDSPTNTTTRDAAGGLEGDGDTKETAIVLASWMRNESFWRSEMRRTCGLDLTKNKDLQARYTFLDQLQHPFAPAELERSVQAAVAKLSHPQSAAGESSNTRVILVLDNPDVLLALGLASAHELSTALLRLRSMVHATIVTCAADTPLLGAAAAAAGGEGVPPTPLEAESAAFAVQQGHGADFVLSARELETGAARDVSGVLRVTRGGAAFAREEEQEGAEEVREMEALYLVQRDGNVKVFERGAASS